MPSKSLIEWQENREYNGKVHRRLQTISQVGELKKKK